MITESNYILVGHTPVAETDLMKWARWFGAAYRHVAKDIIAGVRISTVFLGMDHRFGSGLPLLFETMIFGSEKLGGYQTRCSTWEEAEEMHQTAVNLVKENPNA